MLSQSLITSVVLRHSKMKGKIGRIARATGHPRSFQGFPLVVSQNLSNLTIENQSPSESVFLLAFSIWTRWSRWLCFALRLRGGYGAVTGRGSHMENDRIPSHMEKRPNTKPHRKTAEYRTAAMNDERRSTSDGRRVEDVGGSGGSPCFFRDMISGSTSNTVPSVCSPHSNMDGAEEIRQTDSNIETCRCGSGWQPLWILAQNHIVAHSQCCETKHACGLGACILAGGRSRLPIFMHEAGYVGAYLIGKAATAELRTYVPCTSFPAGRRVWQSASHAPFLTPCTKRAANAIDNMHPFPPPPAPVAVFPAAICFAVT